MTESLVLLEEIGALRAEIERVTASCQDVSTHFWRACQENNLLRAENAALRNAFEQVWAAIFSEKTHCCTRYTHIQRRAKEAKAALVALGELEADDA